MKSYVSSFTLGLALLFGGCAPPIAQCPKPVESCGAGAESHWSHDGVACVPCEPGHYCPDGFIVEPCADGFWDHDENSTTQCVAWASCEDLDKEKSSDFRRICGEGGEPLVGDAALSVKTTGGKEGAVSQEPAVTELAGVSVDARFVLYTYRGGWKSTSGAPPSQVFLRDVKSGKSEELDLGGRRNVVSAVLDSTGKFAAVYSSRWHNGEATGRNELVVLDLAKQSKEIVDLAAFHPRELLDLQILDRGRLLVFAVDVTSSSSDPMAMKGQSSRAIYRYDVQAGSFTAIATSGLNSNPEASDDAAVVAFRSAEGQHGHHGPNYQLAWWRKGKREGIELEGEPRFAGSGFVLSKNGRSLAYDSTREQGEKQLSTSVVMDLASRKMDEVCALPSTGRLHGAQSCAVLALSENARFLVLREEKLTAEGSKDEAYAPVLVLLDRNTKKRTVIDSESHDWNALSVSNDGKTVAYQEHGEQGVAAKLFDVATLKSTVLTPPEVVQQK